MKRAAITGACAAALALIVLAVFVRDAQADSRIVGAQMLVRALMIAAALRRWRITMFVLFIVAFVPVGLYLLGTASYLAAAGVADLVYLACAIAVTLTRPPGNEST